MEKKKAKKTNTKKAKTPKAPAAKQDPIKWLLVGGLALLLVVGGYCLYRHYRPNVNVTFTNYPIQGIDVSNHNGVVNFKKVAGEGYSFVYIKATEGISYRDKRFARNARNAAAAGLKVGAYHYFRKGRDGAKQADNLLGAIAGKRIDLPLVIDVEDAKNDNVDRETTLQRLKSMVARLTEKGYRVMIYTNGNGYEKYVRSNFEHLPIWLSSFVHPDNLGKNRQCQILQYCHWGSVAGVHGEVDLNVFVGQKNDWKKFLNSKK